MANDLKPNSSLSPSLPAVHAEFLNSRRDDVRAAASSADRDAGPTPSEFGSKGRSVVVRELYGAERDLLNIYVALVTLARHMANFETLLAFIVGVGSTCFYTLYSPDSSEYLATRLDFTLIGTAVVFPISFLINETFKRRELGLQRLAHFKALLCQIQTAMLLWRWKNKQANPPSTSWKSNVDRVLRETLRSTMSILRLPKWNANRHIFTKQGRDFRHHVINRHHELTRGVIRNSVQLHGFVEDLKDWGLTASEATRLNQYTYLLQMEFESLIMIKTYRTTNIARSFVRIMVLLCPAFYGPYFGWIARSYSSGVWTSFTLTYAILLTLMTTFVLQGLVKVQRALEDPFVSPFQGEAIRLEEEEDDINMRLDAVLSAATLRD